MKTILNSSTPIFVAITLLSLFYVNSLKIAPTGNYKVVIYDKIKEKSLKSLLTKNSNYFAKVKAKGVSQKFIMSSAFKDLGNVLKNYNVIDIYADKKGEYLTKFIPELENDVKLQIHILPIYDQVWFKNAQ